MVSSKVLFSLSAKIKKKSPNIKMIYDYFRYTVRLIYIKMIYHYISYIITISHSSIINLIVYCLFKTDPQYNEELFQEMWKDMNSPMTREGKKTNYIFYFSIPINFRKS